MKPIVLKRNKSEKYPFHFIVYDTETYPISKKIIKNTKSKPEIEINEHNLSFGYAFYVHHKDNNFIRKDVLYFESKEEFTKFIIEKAESYQHEYDKPLYVFAHNQAYDFRIAVDVDILKHHGYNNTFSVYDSNFIIKFSKKYNGNSKRYYQIIFLSTTNYFKTKLDDLGKMFNLPKLDFKFNQEGFNEIIQKTDKAKKYCFRDVEILEKAIIELIKFQKGKCNFSYTVASMSFNIFRHLFYKENIIMHKNPEIEELERKAYFGGRTECFRLGKFKNVYKLDINSMYPFVMKNNPYPVKLVKFIKKGNKKLLLKLLNNPNFLIIAHVYININEPKIPYKNDDKLIFPVGQFDTFLCEPELKLLSDDEIIDVDEILVYEHDYLFKDFVNHFYNLRLKYKKENNQIMQYFTKIVLNSLYGKFAQKKRKETRYKEFDNIIKNGCMDFRDGESLIKLKFINGFCFKVEDYENGFNTFIPISAFVTSYARSYLFKLMKIAKNNGILYYVDTDSLFVDKFAYEQLKNSGYVDNKELGKLKLEGIVKILHLRNVKDYSIIERNKRKRLMKDRRKRIKKIHKIKGVKKEYVKNRLQSIWKINRFLGFGESLRFYNLTVGDINEIKKLKRQYEKGEIYGNIIKPFKLI